MTRMPHRPSHLVVDPHYSAKGLLPESQKQRISEVQRSSRPAPTRGITEQDFRMMGIRPVRGRGRALSWPLQAMEIDEDEEREERLNSDNTLVDEGVSAIDTIWPKLDTLDKA
jgi:hypothetical protein